MELTPGPNAHQGIRAGRRCLLAFGGDAGQDDRTRPPNSPSHSFQKLQCFWLHSIDCRLGQYIPDLMAFCAMGYRTWVARMSTTRAARLLRTCGDPNGRPRVIRVTFSLFYTDSALVRGKRRGCAARIQPAGTTPADSGIVRAAVAVYKRRGIDPNSVAETGGVLA